MSGRPFLGRSPFFNKLCDDVIDGNVNEWKKGLKLINSLSLLSTEIQAAEAMKWLREAGFPQYSQMYTGEYRNCRIEPGIVKLSFVNLALASKFLFQLPQQNALL